MARTTINSLGIPADTIVSADLDYPLTDFSSTGIDDNATSTALTIDSSGNITVTGTVDGRDLATDGTKLDGIAASATNYGDSDVATYISGSRTYGNITTTGYIAGPSTFTIDPAAVGDNTGTLVIAGNLQVDGTTTTINSTTMTVDDLNITLASGAANAAAANGAGITVDGASATFTYNGTANQWNLNKGLNVSEDTGSTPTVTINNTGTDATDGVALKVIASGRGAGIEDASIFSVHNNSSELFTVQNGGKVGIGTTSPAQQLHVAGGASASTTVRFGQAFDTSVQIGPVTATASGMFQFLNASGTSMWSMGYRDGGSGTDGTFRIRKGATLDTSGPLTSIGTDGKLTVESTGQWGATFTSTATNNGGIIINRATGYNPNLAFQINGSFKWYLNTLASDDSFNWYNSAGTTPQITITQNGDLGINATSPSSVISSSRILHIGSGGNTTISVRSTDGVNDRNAILELLSTGNGGSKSIIIYGDTDTTPGTPSPLSFQSYHNGNRTERLVLNEDGFLGIGVESTIYHMQLYRNDSAGIWQQWTNSTTGTSATDGSIIGIDSNEDLRIIQQESSKNVEIWNNISGTSTQILTVDHNGRIGFSTGGNSLSATATFYSNDNAWPLIFQNTVSGGETFYAGPTNNNFSSGAGKFIISDHSTSSNAFFQYQKSTQHLWLGSYNVKNDHRTILAGKGVESSGVNYGSYGQLEFYANNNYTGSAHRWLITNAIRANVFGIIRSSDATTSASIGANGGTTNGTTDFAIDGDGRIGMGTEQPTAPLEVVHTNLSAEPYSGIIVKNTSTSGNYFTGVTADGVGQSHFRFALNGALKWQWRVGNGSGVDRMDLYSWTKGSNVTSILNDGSFCVGTTSITNYAQTSGTGNLAYRADNGSSGGSLIVTNNADRGWALAYFNKFAWSSGDDNRLINWYTNGSSLGSVTTNGSTVTYGGTSDYRKKQNVVSLSNAIDRVKQLNPIRFEWINEITPGTFDGFLAHEVQEVVPEAVDGVKDAVDEDGEIKPQSMDPGKLVPLLTAALQEAIARIEALEGA